MDILTLGIIIIVVLTVLMVLVKIFFKNVFRIISIIWLVVFIASVVLGLLIYADVADMRKKCTTMPPAILVEENGNVLAGFAFGGEGEPTLLDDIADFQEARDSDDFDALLAEKHCKIAFVNMSAIENISEVRFAEDSALPGDMVISIIRSDDPAGDFAEYLVREGKEEGGLKGLATNFLGPISEGVAKNDIRSQFGSDLEIKAAFFGGAFVTSLDDEGPSFLFGNFKEGEIEVFEETILFKTIKFFPASLFDKMLDNAMKLQTGGQDGTDE